MPEALLMSLNGTVKKTDFLKLSAAQQFDDFVTVEKSFDNSAGNNLAYGIFIVLLGAFCFGTMHVPIRIFATIRDCLFVQWVMSLGSLFVGFGVNAAMGSPPLRLTVSGGGAFWAFANSISQYVIAGLGLGPALLLWSTTNILTGWSACRFGLFGLKAKVPEHEVLNVVGLVILLTGGICFAFVRKSNQPKDKVHVYPNTPNSLGLFEADDGKSTQNDENGRHLTFKMGEGAVQRVEDKRRYLITSLSSSSSITSDGILKRLRKWLMRNSHRLLCILLALFCGFFYSVTVIPVLFIQDNLELFPDAPLSGLNYIFSHYFGIFLSSSAIFIVNALIKRNNPTVNGTVILPSLLSGAIWGCGMACLFLANDLLTPTVTYPVLVTLPGCVASLWSIYFFKEIEMNRRNSLIIFSSFTSIFCGAFMIFVSKSKVPLDKLILFKFSDST
uniref:EamA domain-containing protein n=1 Tax=Globodera pallida TaxID=36090 RepID=A0A183C704_GLOPA